MTSLIHSFQVKLEVGMFVLWSQENRMTWRKTLKSKDENQQQTQPTRIKPEPGWREASALTTAFIPYSLHPLPISKPCSLWIRDSPSVQKWHRFPSTKMLLHSWCHHQQKQLQKYFCLKKKQKTNQLFIISNHTTKSVKWTHFNAKCSAFGHFVKSLQCLLKILYVSESTKSTFGQHIVVHFLCIYLFKILHGSNM